LAGQLLYWANAEPFGGRQKQSYTVVHSVSHPAQCRQYLSYIVPLPWQVSHQPAAGAETPDISFFGTITTMSSIPDKRPHKPTKRFGEEAEPATSSKKQKTGPAKVATKPKPTKLTTKKTPATRSPSVEIEEIDDPTDRPKSNPPRDPTRILESADGSDDDNEPQMSVKGKRKATVIPDSDDEVEIRETINSEPAAESAEAELSMLLSF